MNEQRGEYDAAYGCFLVCGLTALLMSLMEAVPKDEGTAVLLGFFVAIPLVFASFGALVGGIVLCIRLQSPRLMILTVMSVLYVVTMLAGHGSTAFYLAISIPYGLAVVWICGAWFLILRRGEGATP